MTPGLSYYYCEERREGERSSRIINKGEEGLLCGPGSELLLTGRERARVVRG